MTTKIPISLLLRRYKKLSGYKTISNMKYITYCYLITGLMMSFVGYAQVDNFAVDIKLSKDTLYPFDLLEFEVIYKVLTPKKAYPFENSSYLQIKMEEPESSEWFMFSGPIVSQFGNPNDIEGEPIKKLTFPLNHVTVDPIWIEYVPTLKFTNNAVFWTGNFRPGKYLFRVVYSPDKHILFYDDQIEECENCLIKTTSLIVSDRYPEKDQAAYKWIKKLKYPHCFYLKNYLVYTNEEYIEMGEEFLRLFPESCFFPFVHCKIGDSLRRIYEQDVNKDKAPPEETIQRMQTIIMHLSYYKQIKGKGHDSLYIYYGEMYKKFQDRLLRFKARHGIK